MTVAAHRFSNELRRRDAHHPNQRQLTPGYVLEPIRALLGEIELDPCTEQDNPTRATRFYSPPIDGLAESWIAKTIFCNPPYGEVRAQWVRRCIDASLAGSKVILLMPASTETQIFQLAARSSDSLILVQARLRFGLVRKNGRQEAASHGSAIFGFGIDVSPLTSIGVALKPHLHAKKSALNARPLYEGR